MPAIPYVKNPTWADGSGGGTSIDAADLNKLEAGIFEVSLAPAVRVYYNGNQSIPNGVVTTLAFNQERFNQVAGAPSTMHDNVTNNSRLTCRYAGIYQITANIYWASAGGGGPYTSSILYNGTTTIADSFSSADTTIVTAHKNTVSSLWLMAVNDYVQVQVFQNSGAAQNVEYQPARSPEFMMVRVG